MTTTYQTDPNREAHRRLHPTCRRPDCDIGWHFRRQIDREMWMETAE